MSQNEQPTHIAMTIEDANTLLTLVNEIPTKYGAPVLEILKKAQPFVNQPASPLVDSEPDAIE